MYDSRGKNSLFCKPGVSAVVLLVAEPFLLDALPVVAGEFVRGASLVWKRIIHFEP